VKSTGCGTCVTKRIGLGKALEAALTVKGANKRRNKNRKENLKA